MRARGERITSILKSLPVFRHPIETDPEDSSKSRGRGRGRGRNQRPTNPRRPIPIPENSSDFTRIPIEISQKNQSEIVLLENYYSLLQINEKGKLVGEKLRIWKSKAPDETDEDSESESGLKLCNGTTENGATIN